VAALVAVVALLGGGSPLDDSAEAHVEILLGRNADIDGARQQLISDATSTWQATRIAETTEDDSASVEFAIPGTALDGMVAELRRHPLADEVDVSLEVDPSQLEPDPLATEEAAPEPIRLRVDLTRSSGGGPWVTIVGAMFVAVLALVALVFVQRRFSGGDDELGDGLDGDNAPRTNWN